MNFPLSTTALSSPPSSYSCRRFPPPTALYCTPPALPTRPQPPLSPLLPPRGFSGCGRRLVVGTWGPPTAHCAGRRPAMPRVAVFLDIPYLKGCDHQTDFGTVQLLLCCHLREGKGWGER